MFNTQRWADLIADTYGYESGLMGEGSTGIFFNRIADKAPGILQVGGKPPIGRDIPACSEIRSN